MAYATRRSYAGAAPACTLTNAITSADTTAALTGDVTNWNNTANGSFYMVIDPGLSTEEKVLVGTRSSTSLSSITRGVDGTTASAHSAGATCYPVFTATDADQANKVASTLTTKGDLLVTDGSVLNRLAVGTNDYVLKADSSATNGVAWGQVAAAGIASDAVTTAKILDANVTTAKIADGNVTTAKIADVAVTGAKLANFTVDTKTTDYTFVVGDRHKRIVANKSSAITFTVPNSVFSAGDTLFLHNINSGTLTVSAGVGVTLNALSADLLQWQGATLYATSASSFILFPTGGAVKIRKVDAFTASGTWTVPTGVTYAIAHITGGGGSVGTASTAAGGNSSVAFASGTVTATGGAAAPVMSAFGNYKVTAGTANSGQGAKGSQFRGADVSDSSVTFGGDGAYVVAGASVTAGASITVTVGSGGTAGTNGAAGGSGYVWIEYEV